MIKKTLLGLLFALSLLSTPVTSFASVQSISLVPASETAGWYQTLNGWYYMENGSNRTGWLTDQGHTYYLDDSGLMLTGWQSLSDSWYYFYPDGAMAVGESYIDGKAYTFSAEGIYLFDGIKRAGLEDDLITLAFERTYLYETEITDMISLINQYRASNGKNPIRYDRDLTLIANYRSAHMDKYGYVSHDYNGKCQISTVATTYYGRLGKIRENLSHTKYSNRPVYPSVLDANSSVLTKFKNSPAHNSILLEDIVTRAGIGYYFAPDKKQLIVTQIFATDW